MKKLLTAVLSVSLMLSLTACGSSDLINASNSADDILKKAVELNQSVDNLESSIEANLKMGAADTAVSMNVTMDMVCFNDPEKVKLDTSISMLGQHMDTTTYTQKTENGYETYAQDVYGSWTKETMSVADYYEIANTIGYDAASYISNMIGLTKEGLEKLDGVNTVKLTGSLSDNAINDVMKSSNLTDMYDELLGTGGFNIEFSGDIPVTAWIEIRTGYILRMDIDMTEIMQNYMNDLMAYLTDLSGEDAASSEFQMEISEYMMTVTYFNHNSAEDFETPSDAVSAP